MISNYSVEKQDSWTGRVDSVNDFESFRWHQWVKIIDLNDEDLKGFEGKFAVGILGFECDCGIESNKGRVGAENGPKSIRKELSKLPCDFPKEVKIFDCGNVNIKGVTLEEAQKSLGEAVDRILDLNIYPILLGGGHEIAFGHYQGLFNKYAKTGKLGIINFDAHFDCRPYEENGPSSGTMFRQIHDLNKENSLEFKYLPIGIQKHSNTVSLFKFIENAGLNYILAKDIVYGEIYKIFDQIDKFTRKLDHIYITICSDVFSSAYAPGVSAPQPLGLDPEIVIILLKHILQTGKVVSFDIAEVSPRYDKDNSTASLAATIIYSFVSEMVRIIFD